MTVALSIVILGLMFSLMPKDFGIGQTPRDADVRELQHLEMVWNEAHEHGDSGALDALWADDLEVAVPKMPVMTKAEVLGLARSGRMKFLQ